MGTSDSGQGIAVGGDDELFPEMETVTFDPTGVPVPAALVSDGWRRRGETPSPGRYEAPVTTLNDLDRVLDADVPYMDIVYSMMDESTCALCGDIVRQLRSRSLGAQVQGTRELARLKAAAADGADPGELADIMADFEVVADPDEM